MTHWFTLILNDTDGAFAAATDAEFQEVFDRMGDKLFEAGCDDGTFGCSECIFSIGFYREADSLEEAVRSAISDVQAAGYHVARVEVDPPPFVEEINAQLAGGSPVSN